MAETEELRRRKDRRDKELPRCVASVTDADFPIRANPSMDTLSDRRTKLRTEREEEKCAKSMADTDPAMRHQELVERLLPVVSESKIDTAEPN
jgi:hypothetical protein